MHINRVALNNVSFSRAFYSKDFKTEYSRNCFKDTEEGKKLDRMVYSFTKLSDKKNQNVKIELDYDNREQGIGFIFGRIWDKDTKYNRADCISCGTVFELKYDGIDKAIKEFKQKVDTELNKISSDKS